MQFHKPGAVGLPLNLMTAIKGMFVVKWRERKCERTLSIDLFIYVKTLDFVS